MGEKLLYGIKTETFPLYILLSDLIGGLVGRSGGYYGNAKGGFYA
jgi:hypothetical protein